MNLKRLLLTAAITTACIVSTNLQAKADTYRAGKFTINIFDTETTRVYVGCDQKNRCIRLEDGTNWRDQGYRGTTWVNGDYYYSVSWKEDSDEGMYLTIVHNNKRILREKMVAIAENLPKVDAKVVTWCDVVNIKTGQLALRFTPNGKSRAGLNNGNEVLLHKQQGIWAYVTVFKGPNKKVEGLQGWVNSNYLTCTQETID
ncbi:hypothetical protein [Anabaenopsis elenkinii]|jgi:hypothetical protein|uniref:SH3b domain-containing protein n=1 Tax=Anabaenopsis elenkinii CCIBt3563 TaxID=2779889 RepID=A0A7S6REQ7_9CYAN|nr:hypothetical protein [Anabaenopsis elenkinii]QOV22107.1 hypothetical protein IM676_15635 [Anabaenopsis elenkinii CCIBt3563]